MSAPRASTADRGSTWTDPSTRHDATSRGGVNYGDEAGARRGGVTLSLGYADHSFENNNGGDTSTDAVVARLGVQANSWLSFEIEGHFGLDDGSFEFQADEEDFNLDDNSDGDLSDLINAPGEFGLDYLVGAYARVSWPIGERFDIGVRGGYAYADASSTVTTPGGSNIEFGESESGPSYGASAAWYFNDNNSLRLDYTITDFDDSEAESWALSYQFKF